MGAATGESGVGSRGGSRDRDSGPGGQARVLEGQGHGAADDVIIRVPFKSGHPDSSEGIRPALDPPSGRW